MDDKEKKRGFSGLSDLVSEISGIDEPSPQSPKPKSLHVQHPEPKPLSQSSASKPPSQPSAPETFLCKTCSFHLNDSCSLKQRPYAKTCNLYCQSLQSLYSRDRSLKRLLERIQLILQTVSNPGRLPLHLKILSGAGVIGFIWFMFFFSERDMKPFKTLVSEYQTVSGLKNLAKIKRSRTKPYIKGKIIPVEIDKKGEWIASDFFYPELPENLRTTNLENAGTIVLLEWGEELSACKVTIIDKSLKIIVNEKTFKRVGSIPFQEIVDYLRSLPKK
jgi:hypothetical protein